MVQRQLFCETCQRPTLHAKPKTNHVLHLILTIFTVGLWGLVWIGLGMRSEARRPRCQVCGSVPALRPTSR